MTSPPTGHGASAHEAFRAGRLQEAVQALGDELRGSPGDAQRRTFLFELLCFAGQYDRAERQLDVLGAASKEAGLGAMLYKGALHAERTRAGLFAGGALPDGPARAVTGTLNGRPFTSLEDADPRIGPRLELFAAGGYLWLPLEHVARVRLEPPRRLRDTLWATAAVTTGPSFRGRELGEVLLPVLAPGTAQAGDDRVRLGRMTDWAALPDGREAPIGQKLWLVDGEEVPLLEVRDLVITPLPPTPEALA
jgi:type VI secretion system protein ImpE